MPPLPFSPKKGEKQIRPAFVAGKKKWVSVIPDERTLGEKGSSPNRTWRRRWEFGYNDLIKKKG
jgi:hypothetical protein